MSTARAREWTWNIVRASKDRRDLRRPPQIGLYVAAIWIVGCLLIAALAQVISPYHPAEISLDARLSPPLFFGGTLDHLLGTDELGRDVLARLIYSIQISMLVAVGGTFISTLLGVSLGFLAAELGGLIDEGVMALVDMQAAVPFMMTALLVITIFGNSLALFVCLVGLHGWERHARIARGLALTARNRLHVTAARTYNASRVHIYARHILPACAPTIVVGMTLGLTETVLLESTLSFLGLGIQPPMSSLGNMVGFGRDYLMTAWWIALAPGLVIAATAIALMRISEALRQTESRSASFTFT
ncbi:ABC transporter permease [Bradyrhizobium niftali]|uniref:ABC transporter permease n=1 Tax=Bradyrhizobium niftali TaxID=2560055 RepID=A0A4Y9L4G7_9BRAD|nr:ABC transporter permease [Bradyrhizobium niftali]TFV38448.1 ABC transporter permease [Bradyrhizobium niftali]